MSLVYRFVISTQVPPVTERDVREVLHQLKVLQSFRRQRGRRVEGCGDDSWTAALQTPADPPIQHLLTSRPDVKHKTTHKNPVTA